MSSSHRDLPQFRPEVTTFAILLGRILAFCVHPFAAWQVLPVAWRWAIVALYVAAAFVTVLSVLLITG